VWPAKIKTCVPISVVGHNLALLPRVPSIVERRVAYMWQPATASVVVIGIVIVIVIVVVVVIVMQDETKLGRQHKLITNDWHLPLKRRQTRGSHL
jgi:hypothetical protein